MITADDVRACADTEGVMELFRRLGYPVAAVTMDAAEWRRAGIELPSVPMSLLARLDHFDLFLAENATQESAAKFLSEYGSYNQVTKSALINIDHERHTITIHNNRRHAAIAIAEPTPHALDRLNLLELRDQRDPSSLFDRALDRELVARQFFIRFRTAVRDLASALSESCPAETAESIAGEALLILSRLLFLSFVQEKGWLNGERRFLVDRAEAACREGSDFFATVLLPLFFGCLNTPRERRDATARILGEIPYLNGGLFEPSAFERRNPAMHAPNDLMRRIIEEVFEKFDFTADETETDGIRVDPEMLGKVFESLMAEEERAVSGSFYTPREIVETLTGRAIAEWVSGGERDVRDGLLAVLGGEQPAPELRTRAPELLTRLETITVLDPACGSGAFLLAALTAIERLIVVLSGSQRIDLRQRIVERSLYGVDLKPEAVRLCELRLWLAIVAGSNMTLDEVRPLPNLDRNILQGNSLLSPLDFLGSARTDIYRDWAWGIRAQRDLIERYRSAGRDERPALYRLLRANDRRLATDLLVRSVEADERELQVAMTPRRDLFGNPVTEDLELIRSLQQRLMAARRSLQRVEEGEVDFFSFDIHFAHVMAGGGFDVVAGNPPWVRNGRIDPETRAMVRERYQLFRARGAPFHQPDLSVAFIERSVAVAAPDGVVSLLVPAKVANAAYAAPLREFLASETSVVSLIDWTAERRRHFNADTFPLAVVARRGRQGKAHDVDVSACGAAFTIPFSQLSVDGPRSEWCLAPPDVARILARLRIDFPSLERILGRVPVMGVKTGDNGSFFLTAQGVENGWLQTDDGLTIPTEFVCRCVRGRAVRRWSTLQSEWMLWPPAAGWRTFPAWLQQLATRRGAEPGAMRLSYVRPEHVGIKVAWKDVSRGMAAVVLPENVEVAGHTFVLVPNQTLYSIDAATLDEAYAIAGILNSVVIDALLLAIAEQAKDDHYRYFARTVAGVPFPMPDGGSDEWQRLVRSSRAGHRDARTPAAHDEIVAALYRLTGNELEVLRAFVARRLAAR